MAIIYDDLDIPAGADDYALTTECLLQEDLDVERALPIPSASELLTEEFDLPADVPLGAPMTLHLHNHGANTWNVLSLEALVSSP